jgi:hypothetical protein
MLVEYKTLHLFLMVVILSILLYIVVYTYHPITMKFLFIQMQINNPTRYMEIDNLRLNLYIHIFYNILHNIMDWIYHLILRKYMNKNIMMDTFHIIHPYPLPMNLMNFKPHLDMWIIIRQ